MNNQPIVQPPSAGQKVKSTVPEFFKHIWQTWKRLPMWLQVGSIAAICLLVLGIAFWIFGRPQSQPVATPNNPGAPVTTPDPETETPPATPPTDPAPTTPEPTTTKPKTPTGGGGGGGTNNGGGGGGGNNGGGGGGGGTAPAEFPNDGNTGPTGCSSYTLYLGTLNITTDGAVYNCIELRGTLTVNANNVTIQNSILRGDSWWGVRVGNSKSDTTNFKLLRSKLYTIPGLGPDNGGYDYGVSQESTGYMEIAYNNISGYKDGVTTANSYIHDNYIHDLSQFVGAHTQDIYVYTGPNQVKIEHNTLINDSPQDQATAAIYIAPDDGHQNNRIITKNFLAGGAYTIYGGDATATNIVVTDNKFSTQIYPDSGYFGWAAYWWPNNSGNIWSGNTWADGVKIGQTLTP